MIILPDHKLYMRNRKFEITQGLIQLVRVYNNINDINIT